MSRLCRLKSYKHIGDDGVWAYGEIPRLKSRVAELETSLARIVWYYDKAKSGSSLPSMTTQAKAEHENTMFGEARKVLTNGHR